MLAPRKKLWSTPSSAIDIALNFASPLDENDVVYDVGCGDGRVLIQMASRSIPFNGTTKCERDTTSNSHNMTLHSSSTHHYCKQFVGIEISPERADEARSNIQHAQSTGQIPSHVSIEIICANALDVDTIDYSTATVIFLYLVPRGLRLIKPIVWPQEQKVRDENDELTIQNESILQQKRKQCRRIITYMSPFENEECIRKEVCRVDHQVGAAWPVYLYYA